MPRFITIAPHLDVVDLETHYRTTTDVVERTRWHLLWLIGQGQRVAAAGLVGYTHNWALAIVRRYNADGPAGVRDRRATNPGLPPLLSAEDRIALQEALASPPTDGGLWTGPRVAVWMSGRLGRPIHAQRGWEAMRAVGFTPQRPCPTAIQADPEAQEAFKKGGLLTAFAALGR